MFYLLECLKESSAAYLMWSSLLQDLLKIVCRKVLYFRIDVCFILFLSVGGGESFRSSMHLSSKLCTDRRISSLIYSLSDHREPFCPQDRKPIPAEEEVSLYTKW